MTRLAWLLAGAAAGGALARLAAPRPWPELETVTTYGPGPEPFVTPRVENPRQMFGAKPRRPAVEDLQDDIRLYPLRPRRVDVEA